ncbi:MAG: FAD-binding oxidoreductase [Rhodospirillaceae bacterium]|nr:FAD-binding oxidoreductase [Rhodospirillaceae bacterium]
MPDDNRSFISTPAPAGAPKIPAPLGPHQGLIDQLRQIVGAEQCRASDDDRLFYAEDTYRSLETPLAAVAPGTIDELSRVAAVCNRAGVALVPRGGGMSYTDGYLHTRSASVTVDMRRLTKIIEINEADMYVTVECGCTWAELNTALKAKNLRTPYWGPLSGLRSVVGGALSQNSVFFGSGLYGSAVEQCIGLTVVLADGTVQPLGGHAIQNGKPFMKHYGPDMMGLFLADAGAMGMKAVATLRLIRRTEHRKHLAYAFASAADMAGALSGLSREGIAAEAMGFDAGQQSARAVEATRSLKEDFATLFKVIDNGGLIDGLKVALAGRGYLKDVPYGMHVAIEDKTAEGVAALFKKARGICKAAGGKPMPASITRIVHADPFVPPDSILGPKGERWVPVHCIVPHSQAADIIAKVQGLYARYEAVKAKHNIRTGFLLVTVGNYGFLIEPVFFWPDARLKMYDTVMRPEHLARLPVHAADEAARAAVLQMRDDLASLFVQEGAVSMQLGKFYHFDKALKPEAWALLQKMKSVVDPARVVNPGALKL